MKVLVWLNGSVNFGGHEVQLTELIPELVALGVDVALTEREPESFRSLDVVHGLGLSPSQVRSCRRAHLPVVLSTVYWSTAFTHSLFPIHQQPQLQRRLRLGVALGTAAHASHTSESCRALAAPLEQLALSYESADLLLPNTHGEEAALRTELGVTTPAVVVPNAANPAVFSPSTAPSARCGILAVGRFEPAKKPARPDQSPPKARPPLDTRRAGTPTSRRLRDRVPERRGAQRHRCHGAPAHRPTRRPVSKLRSPRYSRAGSRQPASCPSKPRFAEPEWSARNGDTRGNTSRTTPGTAIRRDRPRSAVRWRMRSPPPRARAFEIECSSSTHGTTPLRKHCAVT